MLVALTLAVALGAADCSDYGTVDNAARAALKEAQSLDQGVEYGGVVFEYKGKVCRTSAAAGEAEEITYEVWLPPGGRVVGLWHTHPPQQGGFSLRDVYASCVRGIPSYVFSPGAGIRRFVPNARACRKSSMTGQRGTFLKEE